MSFSSCRKETSLSSMRSMGAASAAAALRSGAERRLLIFWRMLSTLFISES